MSNQPILWLLSFQIKDGKAQVVIPNVEDLIKRMNTSTRQLAEAGAKLYVAVSVTDIKSK